MLAPPPGPGRGGKADEAEFNYSFTFFFFFPTDNPIFFGVDSHCVSSAARNQPR
jgi:hypothetical protein